MSLFLKLKKSVRFCGIFPFSFAFAACLFSCYKAPEMTLEEIEEYKRLNRNSIVERTVSRPYKGQRYADGTVGGVWNSTISGDPKSFNLLIAERDAETNSVLSPLLDALADYDFIKKEWVPRAASFSISTDEEKGTLDVFYTLRDDLFWSFYGSDRKVKVTSDDVVFWYDEIYGDERMESSAYNSRFMSMEDGGVGEVTIEKIDEATFVFHFPRIVAEPILATNMTFGPSFMYKKAKDEGGADGVKNLNSVSINPRTLPSMGPYFISEYTPGQRIVYERNKDFWEKDRNGQSVAYPEKKILRILGDENTKLLLFSKGELEYYSPTPEQLEDVVSKADNNFDFYGNKLGKRSGYTVFNSEGGQSAPFWTFNQNPKNSDKPFYKWFCMKEFRQAMSCLLNRERIISQTYRGLAEPKYSFFPESNAYFDSSVQLEYRYDPEKARELLSKCGFKKGGDGFLYDSDGEKVEFDLSIVSTSSIYSDIAQIITDSLKKEGITVNVRQTDFQRLVEQMSKSYDWQSLMIGFSGGGTFPTQGSNVWVSSGNLHLWNPLQEKPATEWEARVDYLYNEASCIVDHDKAFPLWKEYQQIILEQCPVVYLVRSRSFFALQNRWSMENVYYDNMYGANIDHVYVCE